MLPDKNRTYPLHEPVFGGGEWEYVKSCIDTGMVSSVGAYVDKFERMLEQYTGAKHAVAVVNGTAGLHIALKLAGVMPRDEVLVPALTFVASANAVTYCGASPHFVDSEEQTLGMDPEKLRDYLSQGTEQRSGLCIHKKTGKVIRAMLPMHTFGHPVRLDELLKVAGDFHINLVEDAAESIGSLYHGKHTGTFGLLGVLSFNGNKTITTGGGGAILTSNREIAQKAKHLTTTAKIPHAWEYRHDEAGYNYRLPNINAALGCAQLEQVEEFIIKKRKLAHKYQKQINVEGLRHIVEPVSCRSNYWLNAIYLPNKKERNSVLEKTNKAGIKTRPVWRLINTLKMYRKAEHSELSAARKIESIIINLPSSANINVN